MVKSFFEKNFKDNFLIILHKRKAFELIRNKGLQRCWKKQFVGKKSDFCEDDGKLN